MRVSLACALLSSSLFAAWAEIRPLLQTLRLARENHRA